MKEATKQQDNYTAEEYLAFERSAEMKHEYRDGEIVAMAGASRSHNRITGNVFRELDSKLRVKGDCEAYVSDMRVKTKPNYSYPDVVVVCGEPKFEDAEVDTLLNPTVIIEVLSKSTEADDRGDKFFEYRAIPSVKVYLLISQNKMRVEHYTRQPNDEWMLHRDVIEPGGKVVIASIECELTLQEIYERVTFPPPRHLRRVNEEESKR